MEQNKMDLASELFYVGVYNNLLEKEQHESLINLCNSNIIFEKQAIINSKLQDTKNEEVRKVDGHFFTDFSSSMTDVFWYNRLQFYFLDMLNVYYNERKMTTKRFDWHMDLQLLKYKEGCFYDYHVDNGVATPREFSFSYILNDDYEGGELTFEFKGKEYPIKNVANTLVIFPSNLLYKHKVTKVTKGTRFAVVGWMT